MALCYLPCGNGGWYVRPKAKLALGYRLVVGRAALDREAVVRIHLPQPFGDIRPVDL